MRTRLTLLSIAMIVVLMLLAIATPPVYGQGQLKKRKNIEELQPDELDKYRRAVKILKDRSPNEPNSYARFARLHNNLSPTTGCYHKNELFFPWHRSLLYEFEQAIQSIGPEFADVTIPYWDWTSPPRTGKRYPGAFEDSSSTNSLYDPRRRRTAVPPLYTPEKINKAINDNPEWYAFGGARMEEPASDAAFGAFESPFHNDLHDWCGRPMENPMTAAEDPIFWSFHAYIDYIWDRWEKKWGADRVTCLDCTLRTLTLKPKTRDVLKLEDLGYEYQPTQPGPPSVLMLAAGVQSTKDLRKVRSDGKT